MRKYLLSHSMDALQGFTFGADTLKSLVLMSAIVNYKITAESAVNLARLETNFQVSLQFISTSIFQTSRLSIQRLFSVQLHIATSEFHRVNCYSLSSSWPGVSAPPEKLECTHEADTSYCKYT